ncbi:MAG: hypothetical protein KDD39_15135, partial [Bdellovibrionales bacterium]|nr:hypothetical protein [Bdellovibrionales bacterium]
FKFRVTLQSTDRTQSPQVSSITINYFTFSEAIRMSLTSCGGVFPHTQKNPFWFVSFLMYCLVLVSAAKLWRRFVSQEIGS